MKYLILLLLALVLSFQISFLSKDFSYTRFIDVQKKVTVSSISSEEAVIINQYEIGQIKTKTKNIFDVIFVTTATGNILSILLKIISISFFCLFIYKLEKDNLLNGSAFTWLNYAAFTFIGAITAEYFGIMYTKQWTISNNLIEGLSGYTFKDVGISDSILYLIIVLIIKYILKKQNSKIKTFNAMST